MNLAVRKGESPTEAAIRATRKRISETRIKLLSKNSFFASLAMELKIKIIPGIGMLVDGETFTLNAIATIGVTPEGLLLISPEYVEELDDDELMGSIVHEVLHPAFMFFQRIGNRDLWLANVVHDFIINKIAVDSGFKLYKNVLLDYRALGATFEVLYTMFRTEYDLKLADHRARVPQDKQGCKKKHSKNSHEALAHDFVKDICFQDAPSGAPGGGGDGDEEDDNTPQWTHPNYDPCVEKERQRNMPPNNSGKDRQLRNRWRQALAGAKQKAVQNDGWGDLPATLRQLVDELVEPVIDWRQKLSRWVGENGKRDDYTYRRPSRRKGMGGIVLPSMRGMIPTVAVMVDTSGSMYGNSIKEVMSEIAPLIDDLNCTGLFITCDAAVHGVFEEPDDVYALLENLDGGGGSDFRPGFEKLEELNHKGPTIVATDGWITVPDEEPLGLDVMWLLPQGGEEMGYQRPARWGDVIEVPVDD